MEEDESDAKECGSDYSEEDSTFDVVEETRSSFQGSPSRRNPSLREPWQIEKIISWGAK